MDETACAKCSGALEQVCVCGVTLERCESCHGLFFESGELARVLTDADPASSGSNGNAADATPATCPRCQIPMDRIPACGQGRFSYDFCPACNGLWLDAGELSQLEHANLSGQIEAGKDTDTKKRRAVSVLGEIEKLLEAVDKQRDERLARLDKLMQFGLSDAREIRTIRGTIDAEATLAREALGKSRLFEEARRLCIEGLIPGARFESIRQRVTV